MPTRPTPYASYLVLVHRLALLLHASFRPRLTTTPLRFANPSPPSGWIEDFHLQAVEYARHTTERPGLARPQIGWRRLSASTGYCPHPSNPAPLRALYSENKIRQCKKICIEAGYSQLTFVLRAPEPHCHGKGGLKLRFLSKWCVHRKTGDSASPVSLHISSPRNLCG